MTRRGVTAADQAKAFQASGTPPMSAEERPRGASWRFPRKYPGPWRDEWRIGREGHWDPRNPRHVWAAFRRALSTAIMRGAERLHNRVSP